MLFKNRKTGNVLSASDAAVIALMRGSDLYEPMKLEGAAVAPSTERTVTAPKKKTAKPKASGS